MRVWIDRVQRLTASDYATFAEALARAVWIEAGLQLLPFSRLLDEVSRPRNVTDARVDNDELYQRLNHFAAAAYRFLPMPSTCLRRSLVLCALLNRRGIRATVRLGVVKDGAALAAHAWVECEGMAGNSAPVPFQVLQRLAG